MSIPDLLNLNFLVPFVASKIDFSRAYRGLRGMPRRLLLIGHKATAGTANVNQIYTIASESDAITYLGAGSMLLAMWRGAKANADLGLPIDCVAVAPSGTAVAATSTIVVTNSGATVSAAGEVPVYIEGRRIAVGVTTADTQATVATKLITAINAYTSANGYTDLAVTAAATANPNEVKLTCRWAGLTGNDVDVRNLRYASDVMPAGLTLTIPAMSGGATSPDLTPIITAMAGGRWTEIACAFTDAASMLTIEAELATRWLANNMRDGQCVTAIRATNLAAALAWFSSRNSEQVHTVPTKLDMTSPWVTAAMAGADIESTAAIDPMTPHVGHLLSGYYGPRQADHWTIDEWAALLSEGGSPMQIDESGNGYLGRMVTNYTRNVVGAPDLNRRELVLVKGSSYKRWFYVTEFQLKYSTDYKVAEYITDPIPGQKIMTKELAQEVCIGLYQQLMNVGICQNMDYYKGSIVVEIDGPNGKVKVQDEPVFVMPLYQAEITTYPVAGHV